MPKTVGEFSVRRRSKTDKTFMVSLYPPCGLPPEILEQWQRRSFSRFPPELSRFNAPTSKATAGNGARALITFLKNEISHGTVERLNKPLLIGDWLIRFISLDDNPRAGRLIADGSPYSPATIELYKNYYERYIKGDPFLEMNMLTIDVPTTRAFMTRVGMKKKKQTKRGSY
jgi:hypothetical protein